MQLGPELAATLDLAASAHSAASRGNEFFPSTIAFRAAASETFQSWLRNSWGTPFTPERAEYALVPKFGGGTRMAIDVAARDRLLFDALCALLASKTIPGLVHLTPPFEARPAMEDRLARGRHSHVLLTDVVAFFDYIDRSRLVEELVDITGEGDATLAMADLLDHLTAGRSGIPQGLLPDASFLGDVYLSMVDRVLARAAVSVTRWVDDYRFAASSLREAFRIKNDLEVALREFGLVISSAKTRIISRDVYAANIKGQRERRKSENAIRTRIEKRVREEYEVEGDAEEADEPGPRQSAPDPDLEASFLRATSEAAPWGSSPESLAVTRQVQLSLHELGRTGSSAPLRRLSHLLFRQPHSTRLIAGYLRTRIRGGWETDTVKKVAEVVANEDFPYPWQRGWLLHALVPATTRLPANVIDSALDAFASTSELSFIRARAAVLLATEAKLPMGRDLGSTYESIAPASRPDLVAAAARMPSSPDRDRFLNSVRRDPLQRIVEELAIAGSRFDL